MRHYLAFAIFLSAACLPAWGQQRTAGWIADPQSGCRAWNPSPAPDDVINWQGPCVDGYIEGNGTLRWYSKGQNYETDQGQFHRGKLNGHAVLRFAQGMTFEGEFQDQVPNGQGTLRTSKGEVYSGKWTRGCFNEGDRQMAYQVSRASCGFP